MKYIYTRKIKTRNPVTGEFEGINAFAAESTEEYLAKIQKKGEDTVKSAEEQIINKGAETLATIPEDYTEINNSVKNIAETYAKNDVNAALTYGHFKAIPYSFSFMGNYYQEIDGVISVRGTKQSSGIIPAPKNLCFHFGDDGAAKCFLYFYKKSASGDYTVTFDFYNTTTSNLKNYVSVAKLESRMIQNIPDDTYMEICYDGGTVELYGWDGEPFGMDVCATSSIPTTSAENPEGWLNEGGGSGITVHGEAKHIVANGAVLRLIRGYKNGGLQQLNSSTKSYFKLPEGYDYFRIRIEPQVEEGKVKTLTGDVRDLLYLAADVSEEKPISNAVKVLDNCAKVCSTTWMPKKAIRVNNKTSISFKPNVEYNGLIYGSQWDRAHYIGWHVSPHTFLNAVNDEDSIMYSETADNGEEVYAPIYGTVCSAFATMCDGWECPQTNAGFFYDPEIEKYYAHKPPLGQIYTDITSHCVIPSSITQLTNDAIVSAYESIRPTSAKTTRFMSIAWEDVWQWWNAAAGLDYYNNYGYVVHNPRSKADMSTVPYADFDNAVIVNGSARPYKGDKSVYTSAESEVKINIKNLSAKTLYIESESGAVQQISISGTNVDAKSLLKTDGIYYVYTDVDNTKESFEYVTVPTITYTLTNNMLTFNNNDFWYADCNMAGIHYYQKADGTYEARNASVISNANGDYSKWFRDGHSITSVNAVFRKGKYGAYIVPLRYR